MKGFKRLALLPGEIKGATFSITADDLKLDLSIKPEDNVELSEDEKERQLLMKMLEQTGNNKTRAARLLNMSRTALYDKLRKYGIPPGES